MNDIINEAKKAAIKGMRNNEGGPFGAAIVDKNNNIVSVGNNQVLLNNDPTAHAEVVAIRRACEKLNTYDLTGYTLYTTCEPCPMCLSAIIWSQIKTIYFSSTRHDAEKIGFRDNIIYEYLGGQNKDLINIKQIDATDCLDIFEEYRNNKKTIY